MNPRFSIGLRGKLSIIIALSVFAFGAILTLATSRYLARVMDEKYASEAMTLSSFLEANLSLTVPGLPVDHLQSEIEAIISSNSDMA